MCRRSLFHAAGDWTGRLIEGHGLLGGVEPGYLLCLVAFAGAVILYTTYGGFRAVVWTDVLQGVVMVGGVAVMLPLAIWLCGGLQSATDELSRMTPPRRHRAELTVARPLSTELVIPFGTWLERPPDGDRPGSRRTAAARSAAPYTGASRPRARSPGSA